MKQPRREFLTTHTAAATSAFLPTTLAAAQTPAATDTTKEAILGFGSFFFRAHDPRDGLIV